MSTVRTTARRAVAVVRPALPATGFLPVLATVLATLPAAAQDGTGPVLTFGVNQVFSADDNLDLDVESLGSTVMSRTGLSFGLLSETEVSRLQIDASTSLRLQDGPEADGSDGTEADLDESRFRLSYGRAVANAALDVNARFSADQIDGLLTLGDLDSGIGLPEDLDVLNGTGLRRSYGADAKLTVGLQDPLGYELLAGLTGLSYVDASDPSLYDNQRLFAGAALLFNISPVTSGRLGLRYGDFTSDDPDNEDSTDTTLNAALTRRLPNGTAGVDLFTVDDSTPGNSRAGFSLSRAMDLPAGALELSLGATKLEDDSAKPTGRLVWRQDLPQGGFDIEAVREVQTNSDNEAQLFSAVRLGYLRELGPLSQVDLSISYAVTDAGNAENSTETAGLRLVYSHDLTADWAMDLGYAYTQRDEDAEGMARSNGVFLGLRRTWDMRP